MGVDSDSEPLWWHDARELWNNGLKNYAHIALKLDKSRLSVRYAIDAEYREKQRAKMRTLGKKRKTQRNARYDNRKRILYAARQESAATGQHVDLVLVAWGTTPRGTWR